MRSVWVEKIYGLLKNKLHELYRMTGSLGGDSNVFYSQLEQQIEAMKKLTRNGSLGAQLLASIDESRCKTENGKGGYKNEDGHRKRLTRNFP